MRRGVRLSGYRISVVTDPGAELDDFVAVSVSLAFGSLGPGPQVRAQLVTVAGGVSAEAGQHLVRVDADPAGLSPGSVLARLRASGILLGQGLWLGPASGCGAWASQRLSSRIRLAMKERAAGGGSRSSALV